MGDLRTPYKLQWVYKIITNLKNNCSSGHNKIPVPYGKPAADYITSSMVHIIKTSIDQEIRKQ